MKYVYSMRLTENIQKLCSYDFNVRAFREFSLIQSVLSEITLNQPEIARAI